MKFLVILLFYTNVLNGQKNNCNVIGDNQTGMAIHAYNYKFELKTINKKNFIKLSNDTNKYNNAVAFRYCSAKTMTIFELDYLCNNDTLTCFILKTKNGELFTSRPYKANKEINFIYFFTTKIPYEGTHYYCNRFKLKNDNTIALLTINFTKLFKGVFSYNTTMGNLKKWKVIGEISR